MRYPFFIVAGAVAALAVASFAISAKVATRHNDHPYFHVDGAGRVQQHRIENPSYSKKDYTIATLFLYHLDCTKLPEDLWVGIKAMSRSTVNARLAFFDIKEAYDKSGDTKWCATTKPLVLRFLAAGSSRKDTPHP